MLPVTSFAKTGDVIGYAKYTDISAYINHYPIASYNINDYTAVVAEDLANYGFNVVWNGSQRALYISRNYGAQSITPYGTVYKYASVAGQYSFPYLETDIRTYVNGIQVDSFNIDGKTCIYMDSLASCGELVWAADIRAIKLWVDGLPIKYYAPLVDVNAVSNTSSSTSKAQNSTTTTTTSSVQYYSGTSVPTYTSITGEPLLEYSSSTNIYSYEDNGNDYVNYITTLTSRYGFTNYSNKKTDTSLTYYLVKNGTMIGVCYQAKYDEVWIILP